MTESIYCCRKCRSPLFRPQHIMLHEVGVHMFSYRRREKDRDQGTKGGAVIGSGGRIVSTLDGAVSAASVGTGGDTCTSYFLCELVKWMKADHGEGGGGDGGIASSVETKVFCHSCKARIGSLNWAGAQCSCGTWVTPAIQLTKKCVDERSYQKATSGDASHSSTDGSSGSSSSGSGSGSNSSSSSSGDGGSAESSSSSAEKE